MFLFLILIKNFIRNDSIPIILNPHLLVPSSAVSSQSLLKHPTLRSENFLLAFSRLQL